LIGENTLPTREQHVAERPETLEVRVGERIRVSDTLTLQRIEIPREIKTAISERMEAERKLQR